MNLARFGLLKTSSGAMAPDGFTEEVEITEEEARALPREAYTVEFREQTSLELFAARAAGFAGFGGESVAGGLAAMSSRRPGPSASPSSSSANRPIAPRPVKYVKHEKRTTKEFVNKVKAEQGLLDLDGSILEMEARDLLQHFHRPDAPREVDKNLFARNVVWHYYREILAGKTPEFVKEGCNIRTIYYLVKPIFTQKRVFSEVDDFYGNFTEAFKTMVEIGLLSYRDFNILDDNKAFRFLPDPSFNTNVLLLAEKKAFAGRFSALASRYGVMSQVTEGQSKLITADTMLTEMFEAGFDLNKNLSILSFCDFDPVGTSIPYHFVQHLKTLGFHNINEFEQYGDKTMNRPTDKNDSNGRPIYKKLSQRRPCLDIVNPHELDREIVERIRHKLTKNVQDNPSTADWVFTTGGVTGTGRNKEFAISSEQFLPYLDEHLEKKLLPLLAKPAEAVGRRSNFKFLAKALKEYIGTRALRDAEARRARPT